MVIMAIVMVVMASSSSVCGLPREPRPREPRGWSWVRGEGPAPDRPHAGSEQGVSSRGTDRTSSSSSCRALTLMPLTGEGAASDPRRVREGPQLAAAPQAPWSLMKGKGFNYEMSLQENFMFPSFLREPKP